MGNTQQWTHSQLQMSKNALFFSLGHESHHDFWNWPPKKTHSKWWKKYGQPMDHPWTAAMQLDGRAVEVAPHPLFHRLYRAKELQLGDL